MAKKKKERIELRYYEMPQDEYVLALPEGERDERTGREKPGLHFHNLMEIRCYYGAEEEGAGDLRGLKALHIFPGNYPHTAEGEGEYAQAKADCFYVDPGQVIAQMYPKDRLRQKEMLQFISRQAYLLRETEAPRLFLLVRLIREEIIGALLYHMDSVRGLLYAFLTGLVRLNMDHGSGEKPPAQERDKAGASQITGALEYVRTEYMKQVRVANLAQACGMSETHFRRVFEEAMNMQPVDYINLVRIQNACEMMKKTDLSMDTIAKKVGFPTPSTFNRNFKKFLKTSPYQWKLNPEQYEGDNHDYNHHC